MKLADQLTHLRSVLQETEAKFEAIPAEIKGKADEELIVLYHHIQSYFGGDVPAPKAPEAPVQSDSPIP